MEHSRSRRPVVSYWDSPIQLEAVRVFAAIAELKSFRGAAHALRLPRSTISRRLAVLETALETRLLQRTTRHVSLTDAGEAFLTQVGPALAAIADAERTVLDARSEPRGLLRVTATVSMAEHVGGILLDLVDRHPQIRLELDFTDRHVDLVAEGYDIAIRSGALADSSLIARPLGTGSSGYFASPAYLKRRGRPKLPSELAKHDCIVFSGSARGERWRFQHKQRTEEVTVRKRIVANSLVIVRQAAIAGHGIAWLPGPYVSAELARGKLVPVLADRWPPPLPMHLVYPSSRHLAPQVRVALELLRERFTLPH